VAGLVAADSIFELGADVLGEATRLEGHPDNVAAALLGGFVLCSDGHAERFDPPSGLECLLVVPSQAVRTAKAREALPSRIPVQDAVFNIAHASLLVLGLARGDLALVARGLGDRIHQPRRAHLYPRSWELVQTAKSLGALGATISGAGPTILVWCDFEATSAVAARLHEVAEGWAQVLRVPFAATGAEVRSL
jgi:homoserine kinase